MRIVTPQEFICDKSRTCCITGHRRRDLPNGGDPKTAGMKRLLSMLNLYCREAYNEGYRTFISGMAEGIDLMCAKMIFDMKVGDHMDDIRLVCALPYKDQIRELKNPYDQYYYRIILDRCSDKVVVSDIGNKDRYRLRNKFMVDNSSRIIGAYKHKITGSGTIQTINMAKNAGLDMKIISLDENKELFYDTDI